MGVSASEFVEQYPALYHMAEFGTWPSIQAHGLLSTSALLDLFQISGLEREAIELCHRPDSISISHDAYGVAVIRDQHPMTDAALRRCLVGVLPTDWYRILNSRVFFWLTNERLLGLLNAKPYRHKTHCVLTVDTAKLIARHRDKISLSPMNSGATLYEPLQRGLNTFMKMEEFPFHERRKTRNKNGNVVELTVDYGVPDVAELVIEVVHMNGGKVIDRIV